MRIITIKSDTIFACHRACTHSLGQCAWTNSLSHKCNRKSRKNNQRIFGYMISIIIPAARRFMFRSTCWARCWNKMYSIYAHRVLTIFVTWTGWDLMKFNAQRVVYTTSELCMHIPFRVCWGTSHPANVWLMPGVGTVFRKWISSEPQTCQRSCSFLFVRSVCI